MRRRRSKKRSNALICEELEPRILLSADLVGVAVDPASNVVEQQVDETELQTIEAGLQSVLSNQTDESDISTRELVIIDPATPDYQCLVDDLISQNGNGRSFEIVLLDSSANGIEQLNETLAQYQGLNAIHLISHGGEGEIRLGDATLNQDGLQQSAEQISAWGEALNPGGDWLIYGCDIASTATGERFIEQFAALTGADVAASNDVTGHETLGGDWDLEVAEGSIETDVAVGNDGQEAWLNRLDTTTGLLGHWTLDSNAADSSGNSHDGTLTNGASIDNPGSSNPIGDGNLNLDGFNDFVQLNTHVSAFSDLSEGTIAAWINTSYSGAQAMFSITDTADYDSLVVFGMDNGRIFFDLANNNFYSLSVETNASYADGNWHHVAVTVDGSGNSIYIDGVEVSLAGLFYRDGNSSTSSFISSVTSLDSMAIGNLRDPAGYTGFFNGLQDDVRVYDRALSASDITELISNTAPTYDAAGPPSFTAHTITSAANGAASVTTVDMDGDGDLDVVSASQNDNKIAWYENDGSQNFTAQTISTSASGAFAVTTADVDGDGDMDVLSASITDDKIAWYENDGNENFTAHTITLSADIAASVAAADVDDDGDIDVLSASVGDDRVVWYENDGNENFTTRTITSSASGASFVSTVDLDEDGDLDVLSTSIYDGRVAWYENDGNENFTTRTVTTSAYEARQVIAADVDGDGDLDLLSASRSTDKLAWYENNGFESFTLHTITAAAGPVNAVAAADIDNDGDLDVISASNTDDNVVWFENDGSENFTANTIGGTTGDVFSVAVADMDGDGDVDVLATDDAADTVTWYENVMSVTTLDGAPTFVEDGAAVVLDADVNVSDAELDALNSGQGDYNGASLTLVRNGAANSDDGFSFNDGNGITLSGSNLIKSSQIIASFDTTSTAGELVITFTNANGQTPTSADVDNILRQITYSNSNDAPPASVQIDWTFDDGNTGSQGSGGALQAVGSTTVTITAVNDDPTNAGSLPTDITVAENVSSNVDLSAVDFSDVDAGVGTLTVTLTSSTGGNLSAAAGTGITIGGTSTARTLTGTLTDLNNYFNTASNITYLHGTPDTNGDDADTINITINDNGNTGTGGGTNINLGTVNVDITPDNEVPTITNLGGDSLAYSEDDGAQVIDQGTVSVVADVDSSDFDTGTLTVSFQAGSDNAEDVLAIRDQGAGPTNITVSGSAVSYGGTQIGTFTGGSGGTNLVITLDTDADATAVTALVRNITYENTDTENPTTGVRTVRFVLTDGDGGTSVDYDTTVTVSTVNDDPTNAGSLPSDISVTEDVSSNVDLSAINFADVDAGGGSLTVTLTTSTGGNLSAAAGTGITIAGTSKVLTLTGTLTDLNNYFNTASNITYLHGTANTTGNDADTINVTINDNGNTGAGGGTDIDLGTVNVDISAVNEAPSFDGVPSFGEQIIDAAADGANTVHSADLDGDGDIDVLSTSSADNTVAWHENDGSGNFTKHVITNAADFATDVTTADVDGDGDLDVLSSSSGDDTIAWYENDGSQNFTEHTISTAIDFAESVAAADLDGDGDLDVVSGSTNTGDTLVWFENDGSQNFTYHAIANTTSTNRSVTTADVDGDGDFDILSASFAEDMIGWYENDGDGNFTEQTVTTGADGARAVDVADVDGDGDLDVLSASGNDDKIAWYENDGSQNFTAHTITTSANGARSVTAGDMDGDGDLDVLSASSTDSTIAWYENDGSENFSEHIISNTTGFAISVAVADVNGDGDLDVLSAANSADEIAWYENVSTTTLDGTPAFTEDGPAVVLDADVVIGDVELDALNSGNGDYDGASVTLVRNGAANSEDVFSFNDGNGITLSGSNLIKSSQIVASFDTTTTAGELVITFTNANGQTPTSADVNNILRQITYANSNDVPPASVQIDWTFNDGNAGAQGSGGALQAVGSTTVTITAVNDTPTLAATAVNDSLTENSDTTSGAVFATVTIDPIEAGDDIASAQLTLGGGVENSDILTINGTAISGLGSNSSGAITGGHSYSYTQATGVVTITFAASTNAAAAELVLESITYGIDPADQNPSTTARTITLNTVTDNGGGSDTSTDIGETATISVGAVNDDPTNAGSLPSDISVTEDVSSNVDLSVVDFSDVDAGAGTLTVTLTTSTGGDLSAAAGTGITIGGTSTALTLTGTLTDLNNYFNTASNITYLHGTPNTAGNDADTINVTINDNGNTGTGGGTNINLGTVNVDITAVNDDPSNAGSLPSDISVTEDVSSNVDLSAVDFSDVDAASGTLTVTLTTSTGGDLSAAAGTGITLGGTPTALTLTGTLTDLNNYFNTASNITYLHGTANTNGNDADTINVTINDNGNTGSGGGTDIDLGTVNVDIGTVNDTPTLAATAVNDSLTENSDTTSGAVFATVTIDPIEAGDDIASAQLTLGGGIANSDTLTINGTAISGLGSNSSGAISGGHSYSYTQATGVVTITFAASTNAAAAELVLESITYGIDPADQNPSTIARTITLNTVTDNGGGSDTNTDIGETATISVGAVNDTPTLAATAVNDSLTENTDTTSGAVFAIVTIDPIEAGDDIASAQLTLGGGIANSDTLTINGTAITGLGSNSSGAISGGHSYNYTQATGVVTITFAGGTNAAAAELVLESITYGIDPADQNPSTIARTITLNTVTDNGGGSDTSSDIGETATISVGAVNDNPTNAGSLPSDISVTEDVSSNIDLSAIDFADVDAASGTLTVTLTTSTGGDLSAAAGTGITIGGTSTALTLTGTLTDLNNYFNTASNITYLHGTTNTAGNDADTINVTINDNGNTGTGGGGAINLGTVNVDITAVNDDPSNAGSLPSDISVTEDVSSNVDLSAVDFADVDAASGTLTVTLTTSTGGDLSAAAGTGITIGGTSTALTLTGTLTDLNNYFNTASNITYLHGTANTAGDNADTIQVDITDNGNTGTGGGGAINLGTVNVDITAVNDAPVVVDLDGDIHNFTEGDGVVLIEQGGDAVVSDSDSSDYAGGSLTVEVDSGLQPAEDRFSIFNQGTDTGEIGLSGGNVTYSGTLIGTVTGGTGVDPLTVTFNSNATSAAVTALVRNITYENSNLENPTDGTRSVTIDISDGDGGTSLTQNLTLNVSSVNDVPVVDLNGADGAGEDFAATFTEGGGAVNVVDTDATISDVDNTTYQNLSINLSGFLDGVSEQITIAGYVFTYGTSDNQIRTVGSTDFEIDFDGTGFNVMLDGGGGMPEADLQSLLRGVTYENTSQDPTAGDRTINFFAQDSSLLNSPVATSTITVNPQNDAPTATDNANSVSENGFVSGNVITDDSGSGVDSDPEGDGLQVTQVEGGAYTPGLPVTLASGAQVTFQSNGSYTYNTNGQFDGLGAGSSVDDNFTYQIGDGNGGFDTATVTITINGSNNTPSITSADLTLDEGQTVTLGDANFAVTDADDTDFTYTVSGISGGYFQLSTNPGVSITSFTSANLTGGLVQFVDDGNEVAPAFSVTVNDGDIDSNTLAATINFTLVSDSTPVANIDSITVAEGGTVTTLVGGASTVLNNDTGLVDAPVTVSLVSDVTNGSLTLNGDGTFSYTHDGSENFTDSFTYRITDNDGQTADATVTINVTPVSDATPVANADSITVAEGATATTLVGGSSTVLNNDTGLGDTPVTVSLVTDVTNGTLTLNGDGTFSYTHDGSENFTDSFTYRVADNDGQTADATVTINITPVSDATPVANADSITVAEGATATTLVGGSSTVLNNDTGLGDTPVIVSLITDVTNGSLTLNGDGTFSYTHDGSENFTDSFTYRVTDNDGETADATVTINVTPVSDATPVANADSITVAEGGTVTTLVGGSSTVLNNDTGLGDTPVTVSLVTDVTNGSLTLNGDGTFSYIHDGSENFTDSFTYRVTDNDGDTADATVTINITPVSDQTPVANADSITVAEGATATTLVGGSSNVLNNDTGLGDTPVTVSLVTDVTNGTLTLNGDGTFSYTHDGSENFTDSFTYRVTDNDGETADATVTINITPVSDQTPVANADSITVAEGATATTLVGGSSNVLNNDTGLGDTPVTVSLVTDVTNGTLTLNGDGTFSYTHDGSENFTDSFTYRVTDNDGETADATVTINITPVSDQTPVANADSITVAEGATATTLVGGSSTVLNNDTGLGDTPVTVSLVTDVTNGTLTLNTDGTFSYTHDGTENFTDSFTYRVTDNDGQTADATVTINITPVSDETPVANADSITVAEGGTVTTLVGGSSTVLNNDTGLGDAPVTVSLVSDVTNGSLTLNGDGTFSYTHDGSENFTDSFTYRVTDNDGQTADATVTINITPVSDQTPVANADSITVAEGATATTLVGGSSTVLNNDTGLGDTPVTVSLVTDVTNGTLTLNTDGTFSYTHDGTENFTDSFTYRVTDNDGQTADATVTINITPVSDETPVANADSITVAEGGTVTTLVGGSSTVLNNDSGLGDTPVIVSLVTDVVNGTLTLNGDGTFSYTHDGSENFIDSFTYRVTDNDGQTADATVTINITPVSDATPVANADSISVAEGGTITTLVGGASTVLNNDTGLGDTPVTVSLVTDVTNGSLTLNGDGTFSYTHDGSENFTDSFTYRVTDNDGETADATVTINVTPVSDATPVANADSITVAEGGTITTLVGGSSTVLNNDTGLGDTPVTVSLVTDVTNGSLTLNGDGTFSYTHDGSENFTDSFTYRVTDNDGETADATVTINVTPVSDTTPVANADSITVAEGATATTLVGGSSTVLNNDTGLGDTPVIVSLITDVTNGSLTLNGDGTFSYTHDGSENFTDSFTYRVTDNDGETADATVTINVTPVSDETPVANADSITVAEGATATTLVGGSSTVLNNDTGLGDTPVTVSLVTDVTNGSLTLNGDGTFSYTHDGSENFTDSFTYRVTDNDGETADATVTINVTPVSDTTPVANADSITVAEGATATTLVGGSSTVLNNDTGLGDTPVIVSLITDVTNGSLTLNGDGTFSYTHDGSENFTDSFTYRVTDNDGETADATVTINVTPVSDETPVANADSITVAEGATATTLVGGSSTVLNNDTGLGDTPVTVSLVTDVTNGSLTLNGDGTFSYTHDGSENFTDSFTYRVTDNDGETADATVTINITPVSDQTPVANADSITVAEGATATTLVGGSSTVLNNDTGLGDTPVMVSLVTDVTNGSLTLNGDGTFSYTHDGSENFTDSFTYRITDNDGETADATVTINITPVSDATPVANADSITVAEGATATTLVGGSSTVLNNDTGLGDTPVIVSLITNVTNGSLTLNGDGTFSYTHDGSENFTDSFTYRVTDNDGETADATVTINITPVSDATPVANADSITVAEGATATTLVGGSSTVLNNDTGLGDTPVIVSLITNVTNGSLTLNGDGTFSYTHDGSENFTDSFTYRITDNDGETADATVTINITPVSDATPVANADSITVAEGATATTLVGGSSTVLNNDTGLGDTPVIVSLITDVTNGSLTLNGDGTFSYTHDGSENFTDSFTYRVTDNDGETVDATVTINVTPVSDATPVANADSITVAEGATATTLVGGSSTVLNNDTGLGDTPVIVSLITNVTNGSLTLNGDGTFSYTHDGSENFTDSFTYRITDNDGETADATVTINITPVSDQTPVANADSITVAEGATATTLVGGSSTVLNNDTGLSDTPVTVSLITDVTNGILTLNSDGTFSYTHDGSENFTDSFTYRVTDNDGETADATVTINVISNNNPPEASDINFSVLEDNVYTGNLPAAVDGDGDTVTYRLESNPVHGSITLDMDGGFSYTPDADYHGADSFIYSVSDGNGGNNSYLVEIDVVSVNDSPVITSHDENENVLLSLEENATLVTMVTADDPENDAISFAIDGGADLGLFSIDPISGEMVFTHAPDMENPLDADQDNLYQVQVLVSDGNGGTDRQSFTIEVTDVDEFDVGLLIDVEDTPDAIPLSGSLSDGVGITVWAEDPDSSNNRITYSLDDDSNGLFAIDPASGTITLASTVENRDASQFEITVRATSEDGSYSLHTFHIAFNRVIDTTPEPEPPYLDDIIFDLDPEGPVESQATTDKTGPSQQPPTDADTVSEELSSEDQEASLSTGIEERTRVIIEDIERPAIKRLSPSLFPEDSRNSYRYDYYQARLTPLPVAPEELPVFDTSIGELIEVPEAIWHLLDSMNSEMSEHQREQVSTDRITVQTATFGTLALSAGYVAWLLRAGVLSASLLSFTPLWRQIDPLPVLSAHAKRRDEDQDHPPEEDPDEKRLAKLFDRKKKPRKNRFIFYRKDS